MSVLKELLSLTKGKRLFRTLTKDIKNRKDTIFLFFTNQELKNEDLWVIENYRELMKNSSAKRVVMIYVTPQWRIELPSCECHKVSNEQMIDIIRYLAFENELDGRIDREGIYVVSLDGTIGNYELREYIEMGYFPEDYIYRKWIFNVRSDLAKS